VQSLNYKTEIRDNKKLKLVLEKKEKSMFGQLNSGECSSELLL
jgi:hypothetical protein